MQQRACASMAFKDYEQFITVFIASPATLQTRGKSTSNACHAIFAYGFIEGLNFSRSTWVQFSLEREESLISMYQTVNTRVFPLHLNNSLPLLQAFTFERTVDIDC